MTAPSRRLPSYRTPRRGTLARHRISGRIAAIALAFVAASGAQPGSLQRGAGLSAAPLGLAAAYATEGEHELWAGAGGELSPRLGVSAQYRYAWTDFWAVGATLQHRHGWTAATERAPGETAAFVDARLTLDALTWVPSVALGVGASTDWRAAHLRASLCAALAYRPARDWSVKVRLGVEQALADTEPRPFISLSYGWIRGAASGLDF